MTVAYNAIVTLPHLDGVTLEEDMEWAPQAYEQLARAQGIKLDANESMIFALQLQYLRNQVIERPYPLLKAKNLLPMQSEAPAGAEEYAYIIADRVGMFRLISNYADDLPLTDAIGKKFVVNIRSYGGAVLYSIFDQRKAAMSGMPLVQRKMDANRQAAEEKFDQIAWIGDVSAGLYGLTNHPNVTKAAAVNGASASPLWANKTAQEIYNDLVYAIVQQITDTKGVESPDTILLTAARLERARNVFFTDNTGDSALKRFQEAYPGVKIETVEAMATAGVGGTQALVAYRKDSQKLGVETPAPYTVLPPEPRNLAVIVNAFLTTAGTIIFFPLSVTVVYGI